jgi:hypothetical protein
MTDRTEENAASASDPLFQSRLVGGKVQKILAPSIATWLRERS